MSEKYPVPSSPTTLYLFRHCQPDDRYMNQFYGQSDVPLGEKGLAQSRQVAQRSADVPFDVVYSSDLSRAGYLADLLADPRDLPVRRLAVFRERSMGILQGIDIPVLEREHSELFLRWKADRIHCRLPEAENFEDLRDRVVPAVLDLVATYPGKRIALVSHAGPIRVVLAHALGLPLENIFRVMVNLGSVNVIEFFDGGTPRVTLING